MIWLASHKKKLLEFLIFIHFGGLFLNKKKNSVDLSKISNQRQTDWGPPRSNQAPITQILKIKPRSYLMFSLQINVKAIF